MIGQLDHSCIGEFNSIDLRPTNHFQLDGNTIQGLYMLQNFYRQDCAVTFSSKRI